MSNNMKIESYVNAKGVTSWGLYGSDTKKFKDELKTMNLRWYSGSLGNGQGWTIPVNKLEQVKTWLKTKGEPKIEPVVEKPKTAEMDCQTKPVFVFNKDYQKLYKETFADYNDLVDEYNELKAKYEALLEKDE